MARRIARPILWLAALLLPRVATAQDLPRFFPPRPLAPVIRANPRAPAMGGRVVGVIDPATPFGSGIEAEASVGTSVPVLALWGDGADGAGVIALQGGVFARFVMETKERDLVSTDWLFAVPLFVWLGDDWLSLRYRHTSAHIGDEYLERFGGERSDYSRDGLGITAYGRFTRHLALYGGGDVAFNVEPNGSERLIVRGGLELSDGGVHENVELYGGADVLLDQDADWRPRVNLQTGTLFFTRRATSLRLVIEVSFGPSRQGEFHRLNETVVTLGLLLER